MSAPFVPPARYLRERVVRDGECWRWTGQISHEGYGRASVGMRIPAHRFVYRFFVGDPGPGHLHHVCHNRACVNPWHLRPLTHGEHKRLHLQAVSHCPKGHAYDEDNTYVSVVQGYECRSCKACHRERERDRYHARRAA